MNIVDKSFGRRFQEHKLQLQKFKLHITLVDFKLASLVDKWIELAFENDAKEIDLLVETEENSCYTYTLPKTIFVAKSTNYCKLGQPFSWTGVKFYSLQKLRLQEVCLNEEIIQDIIHTCPFITDFGLIMFKGPKILEISNLPKLRNVTVIPDDNYVESVKIDLPNLQIFRLGYSNQCQLDITGCKDLKELWLDSVNITDQLFHFSISRFPHLETLLINDCSMLERVNISVQRLRELRIFSCQKLLYVEIDAPNLSLFRYCNSSNQMAKLFLKNAPCCLELNLKLDPNDLVDTHWFLNLREFLLMSNQRKYLKILVFLSEAVTFDLKELSGMSLPPPVELDLMKLDIRNSALSIDYVTFIDGLLWSCRPKILSVPTGLESLDKCIKVLCEMLVDREDLHRCLGDHKCWRSHLKGAEITSIAGNEDERLLDCKTLLDMLPTLAKDQEIQFRLDWEHHLHGYLD
ncbi:uncharacterized protein LOC115991982 isoform X2 [Quercus lobata]|nr:uncharacterized protein LOC115991982 isoform X2 [Quercus lobata]